MSASRDLARSAKFLVFDAQARTAHIADPVLRAEVVRRLAVIREEHEALDRVFQEAEDNG